MKKIWKLSLALMVVCGCSGSMEREPVPLEDGGYLTYHRMFDDGESLEKIVFTRVDDTIWHEQWHLIKTKKKGYDKWFDSSSKGKANEMDSAGCLKPHAGIEHKATYYWLPEKYRQIDAVYKDIDITILQNGEPTVIGQKQWKEWDVWEVKDKVHEFTYYYDTITGWLVGREKPNGDIYVLKDTNLYGL